MATIILFLIFLVIAIAVAVGDDQTAPLLFTICVLLITALQRNRIRRFTRALRHQLFPRHRR